MKKVPSEKGLAYELDSNSPEDQFRGLVAAAMHPETTVSLNYDSRLKAICITTAGNEIAFVDTAAVRRMAQQMLRVADMVDKGELK